MWLNGGDEQTTRQIPKRGMKEEGEREGSNSRVAENSLFLLFPNQ